MNDRKIGSREFSSFREVPVSVLSSAENLLKRWEQSFGSNPILAQEVASVLVFPPLHRMRVIKLEVYSLNKVVVSYF